MDDQSVNQQGITGTQALLAQEAGSQSGTAAQTQAGGTSDLAGSDAATGAGAETDATTKTGPEALQARIDELQHQNDEMRDRLARIESEEAAAQAAADRHAAEVAATSEADAAHAAAKALQVLRNTAAEAETIALAYRRAARGDAWAALVRAVEDALADLVEAERRTRQRDRLISHGYVRCGLRVPASDAA